VFLLVARMTSLFHHTKPLVEMVSHELFCLGWPQTMISQLSASQVTGKGTSLAGSYCVLTWILVLYMTPPPLIYYLTDFTGKENVACVVN
jgi:hypothetical protein